MSFKLNELQKAPTLKVGRFAQTFDEDMARIMGPTPLKSVWLI